MNVFEDLSTAILSEDGAVMTVPIRSIPKLFRKKINEKYGSVKQARKFSRVIKDLFDQSPTWKESWEKRRSMLRKLGYDTYAEYTNSKHWIKTRNSYRKSWLLQGCILCGARNYALHHTDYGLLGQEPLESLVPVCEVHHRKLHMFLTEHVMPVEHTMKLLPMIFWPRKVAQPGQYGCVGEVLYPYTKRILIYKSRQIGERCVIENYGIGNKKSNQRCWKKISINNKLFYFDINTDDVRLGYNGRKVPFDNFCKNLEKYVE